MSSIDLEILSKFREISKRLIELQQSVLSLKNISILEFRIINILDINGKFSQKILGDFCNLDKPTTSRLINKMVQQNLVERNFDNSDRRVTYISLTNNGKELLNDVRKDLLASYKNYFNPISYSDKQTFVELLNKTLSKGELC